MAIGQNLYERISGVTYRASTGEIIKVSLGRNLIVNLETLVATIAKGRGKRKFFKVKEADAKKLKRMAEQWLLQQS